MMMLTLVLCILGTVLFCARQYQDMARLKRVRVREQTPARRRESR